MMAAVACFCGCSFSFDGGAGACPRCGEVARLTAGPEVHGVARDWTENPVPAMGEVGQDEQARVTGPELAEILVLLCRREVDRVAEARRW